MADWSDNPGHILPPNADDAGWEPHEAVSKPDEVATDVVAHEDGTLSVDRYQDVEPILEYAKEMARTDQAWSPSRELYHAAEFPMVLCEKYMADKGIGLNEFMTNPEHLRAMLNDPNLADFRIGANTTHKAFH